MLIVSRRGIAAQNNNGHPSFSGLGQGGDDIGESRPMRDRRDAHAVRCLCGPDRRQNGIRFVRAADIAPPSLEIGIDQEEVGVADKAVEHIDTKHWQALSKQLVKWNQRGIAHHHCLELELSEA